MRNMNSLQIPFNVSMQVCKLRNLGIHKTKLISLKTQYNDSIFANK
jgi:hypothetical protein